MTYEAIVTDDAIQGDELFNEAWINDGEHDSVEGDVLDKKVPSTGGTRDGDCTRVWDSCLWSQRQQQEEKKKHIDQIQKSM